MAKLPYPTPMPVLTTHESPVEPPARIHCTPDSISSQFADSGLGVSQLRTPSSSCRKSHTGAHFSAMTSPSKTTNSVSGRLERLAALAWKAEEDERLDEHTRAAVQSYLHAIEERLEIYSRGKRQASSDTDLSNSAGSNASSGSSVRKRAISRGTPTQEPLVAQIIPVSEVSHILEHLHATVASMRTRLLESKHLHSLAMSKLSSIAQSNVNLATQLSTARKANTSISHANAALRMRVDDLEATTSQQAVAVGAMTGAVAGLESYVQSSTPTPSTPRNQHVRINIQHTPNSGARRPTVVRGSGRFRGKYPVSSFANIERRGSAETNMQCDEAHNQPPSYPPQNEFHEGILAWVRGFRDVEASWREMDGTHRTPTRFRNVMDVRRTPERSIHRAETGEEPDRAQSRSEEESVLLQGDKAGGGDIFRHEYNEEFGDFQTVTSNC